MHAFVFSAVVMCAMHCRWRARGFACVSKWAVLQMMQINVFTSDHTYSFYGEKALEFVFSFEHVIILETTGCGWLACFEFSDLFINIFLQLVFWGWQPERWNGWKWPTETEATQHCGHAYLCAWKLPLCVCGGVQRSAHESLWMAMYLCLPVPVLMSWLAVVIFRSH